MSAQVMKELVPGEPKEVTWDEGVAGNHTATVRTTPDQNVSAQARFKIKG